MKYYRNFITGFLNQTVIWYILCSSLGFLLFFFISQSYILAQEITHKKLRDKPILGVYMKPVADLEEYSFEFSGKKGICVTAVIPGSAAEKAGILAEDIILEYDSHTFVNINDDDMKKMFSDYIKNEKEIGQSIYLKIFRINTTYSGMNANNLIEKTKLDEEYVSGLILDQRVGEVLILEIEKNWEVLEIEPVLQRSDNFLTIGPPENKYLFPEYENYIDPYITLSKALIKEYQIENSYKDLLERYNDDEWWDRGFRLKSFRYIHRDPFKLPKLADDITFSFEAVNLGSKSASIGMNSQFPRIIKAASTVLDEDISSDMVVPLLSSSISDIETHLNSIVELIKKAAYYRNIALDKLTKDEINFLYQKAPSLLDQLIEHFYLEVGAKQDDIQYYNKVINLSKKINYQALLESAFILNHLAHKMWLFNLKSLLLQVQQSQFDVSASDAGVSGDVLMIKKTEIGNLIIGGPGFTKYNKNQSIIIDLGGDDIYVNNVGSAKDDEIPISVLIEMDGDDRYMATEPFAQGCGFLGSGLLIDIAGDDTYTGIQLSQGIGFLGTGCLIDMDGNDSYFGHEYHQGFGFWGLGILVDIKGNDEYHANLYAQGVGSTKGLGLLFDVKGDDFYYSTGKHKSSYKTEGIYKGCSQGFGIGFRNTLSGGIGILLDSSGKDHFIAGNFSQGGGYFFGMGILKNSGQDSDTYIASHYGQGFSTHSAAGILIDDGGDDYYKGLYGAVQSAAWDMGVASLIDKSGNDIYDIHGTSFSLAASAHNGFSIFIDMQGDDSYLSDRDKISQNQSNAYHGGSSFSFFIDNGGENDEYTIPSWNNKIHCAGNYTIFVDLPIMIPEDFDFKALANIIKIP